MRATMGEDRMARVTRISLAASARRSLPGSVLVTLPGVQRDGAAARCGGRDAVTMTAASATATASAASGPRTARGGLGAAGDLGRRIRPQRQLRISDRDHAPVDTAPDIQPHSGRSRQRDLGDNLPQRGPERAQPPVADHNHAFRARRDSGGYHAEAVVPARSRSRLPPELPR